MGQQWLHFKPDMVAVRQQASESFKGCRRDIFQQNAPPSPATAPLMRRGTVNSRFSCSLAKPRFLIRSLSVSLSLPTGSQFPVGLSCHSHRLHRLIKCPLKCPQMHSFSAPLNFGPITNKPATSMVLLGVLKWAKMHSQHGCFPWGGKWMLQHKRSNSV